MKIIGTTKGLIKHLEQYRKSQLTQAEYCRNNNLSYHQFGYWRRKENKNPETPLVPVKLAAAERSGNALCALKNQPCPKKLLLRVDSADDIFLHNG